MYCMKCGRETKENCVFCDSCLAEMAASPVKPGTPVQLPSRPNSPVKKSNPRRKAPSPEEQVGRLRRTVQWLALGMVVLIAVLFMTVSILVHTLGVQKAQETIGQNYSTVTDPTEK